MYFPFFNGLFYLFSFSISAVHCFLVWSFIITYIKRNLSRKYNPSIPLNVHCMKWKGIRLRCIASSSRTSMSYFSRLRAILYFSNNTLLFAILIHSLLISNGFFLRWRSYTFVFLNFRKTEWILNMCKIQKPILYLQHIEW